MDLTNWTITESNFNSQQHFQETVFTLGNGYLGTRGTFEEGYPGRNPVTLINGVYDDIAIAYTELANCPDWLSMGISIDGEYFSLNQGTILHYQRQLQMRSGILRREIRWRSPFGKTVDFQFERFTSLADVHTVALRVFVTPVDFSGKIEFQGAINGYPDNLGLKHWEWMNQGIHTPSIWLHLRTRTSGIELGMAARLTAKNGDGKEFPIAAIALPNYPSLVTTIPACQGETVSVEKVVTLYTSKDVATPVETALDALRTTPDYDTLLTPHIAAWEALWESSDIEIEGDAKAQQAVRYNLFQLLQAAPRHSDRVSIPAKTLSGFAYRGHVFWDTEIFLVPFLTYTQPAIARNLLTYRYHTLPGARRKAAEAGYSGAMFAWESADTGDEVTPRWVPSCCGKELVRIWCGDIELHINSDIAYAIWHYWQATQDDAWMYQYGAEIILDTAVFWGSRVEWNRDRHCYEISDVIGPDEYHDHVNNNAFTNRMVQWHLLTAVKVWQWLEKTHPEKAFELAQRLNLNTCWLTKWKEIAESLWTPITETGLIEQAEGFFALEDINLGEYEPRTKSMQALLGIEGAGKRQVLKQADVLMLLYLLRDNCDRKMLQANWDYYNPRTDHTFGSSLSPAIHGILACELDNPSEAYSHFMRAALVDLEDVRGNADEGIHAASTGAVWQAIVFGFGGIRFTDSGPVATPHLPPHWTRLKFKVVWRDRQYEFDLRQDVESDRILTALRQESAFAIPVAPEIAATPFIQGVIFDLDGVLTDTAEYHYLAWKRLADDQGIPFDRAANESMRGLARRESLLHLLGNTAVSESEMQEMMERKNQYYLELIEEISSKDLLPGAKALLQELRHAGIAVALGSASKNARKVIHLLGIGEYIDAIADGYSVTRSKPAPDLFLHAAAQLNLSPQNCVVVEDANSGIQAALAAQMWAVGLGPKERFENADVVLPNLADIHWQDLLSQLPPKQRVSVTPISQPTSPESLVR